MTTASRNPAQALQHLRRYSRDAFYGAVATGLLLPAMAIFSSPVTVWPQVPLAVGWLVFMVVMLAGTRRILTDPWRARPLWQGVGLFLLGGTLTAVAALTSDLGALWSVLPGLALAEIIINRDLQHVWELVSLGALLLMSTILLLSYGLGVSGPGAKAFGALVIAGFTAYLQETTVRLWRSSLELDQARAEAAELATARERLRLSQDLHDILGHALEVVSLKSELAARMSTVDPSRAHAEMVEVQDLARGALQDVRSLVHAQRRTDLATELAGARTLLASADITCEATGDPAGLPDHPRELLGRVLRESVTNLLRHANAHHCRIQLCQTPTAVTLTVTNDGLLTPPAAWGAGLSGLSERVTEAAGTFTAQADQDEFVVTATLPKTVSQ
ncbi:two-component system sensor histidine kinase DesK [Crossiella equi]|uniref:Two-component system sensor histidine kinase DesK n=1 Tax=Crossiella equi TaxID=130796 RepID=A0ABS5A9J8_9PSEU|nr:histidine kinase [Crossiella equi]MBP2473258.1 two-component system sensor histidine kinase DesK [Crossiella equi]